MGHKHKHIDINIECELMGHSVFLVGDTTVKKIIASATVVSDACALVCRRLRRSSMSTCFSCSPRRWTVNDDQCPPHYAKPFPPLSCYIPPKGYPKRLPKSEGEGKKKLLSKLTDDNN